jgi:predicted metal-dependent peptidase
VLFRSFKYDTWSSEEVYDDIFEQAKQNGDDFLNQLGELLDEHLDWEGDGEEDGNNNSNISSKQPKYSKEQMREIRDEVKENMMTAAQSSGAGNVPAEIERMISKLTEPKMNWREILRQQIQSTIRNDYTFMRPSRKGWHMSAVLPGQNFDETIDIAVGIDMSGSIGNEQGEDFLGEVQGIMDEYQDYNIKVWCFDTKVYNEQDFTADGGERLEEYEIMGGGGTEFDCNWEYMKQHDITPKKFIMFTDGYPWGSWGDEDYCDTVFVIHSNRDRSLMAPFGLTTHYEDAA